MARGFLGIRPLPSASDQSEPASGWKSDGNFLFVFENEFIPPVRLKGGGEIASAQKNE